MQFQFLEPETIVETFQKCITCGVNKSTKDYYDEKKNKSGKSGRCKTCDLIRRRRLHKLRVEAGQFGQCKDCGKHFGSCDLRKTGFCRDCMMGNRVYNWKGGSKTVHGYKVVYDAGTQVKEHRLIMEKYLGRKLHPDENVHHINGIRDDNRLENLELWVKSQPQGIRIKDAVDWAKVILERYT